MREVTYFVADDGKKFEDDMACELYEMGLSSLFDLEQIVVLNVNNDVLFPFDEEYNIFDAYYNDSNKVIVKTEKALEDLHKIARYCGWCNYEDDIVSVGTWAWNDDDEEIYYWDYCFKKVSE